MQSILIPVDLSESIIKRLSRLACQAGAALTINDGTTVAYRRTLRSVHSNYEVDTTQALECARVTVESMPRVNGYQLIGKLTHTEAGNIIAMSPAAQGETTPAEWRSAKPTCDHCATARRRNETFIVRCPDGAIKRVGRNCLADFLATDPAQFIAQGTFDDVWQSVSNGWDDDFGGFGGARWSVATAHYVACATASVRQRGFIKRGAEGQCTAGDAAFLAGRCPSDERTKQAWVDGQPTEADIERAACAMKWAAESTDPSDYSHNLRVAVALPTADRFQGILASLPQAYNRHLGQISERAAKPVSSHVGAIGERLDTLVTVERVSAYESLYGIKRVVSMVTDDGNVLITFTTGQGVCAEDTGKRFSIRGTVKRHGDYKGTAQTELSRVAFKPV